MSTPPTILRPVKPLKTAKSAAAEPRHADECAADVLEVVPGIMDALRMSARAYVGDQLSVPQLRCLSVIERNPGSGVADVASRLGVATPTASAMVDRLVRAGAVETCADADDRRRLQLYITTSGHTQLHSVRAHARIALSRVLASCSTEELHAVSAGLAVLKQKIRPGMKP
jgi:DNA-binding MarR family transcriptional regulator